MILSLDGFLLRLTKNLLINLLKRKTICLPCSYKRVILYKVPLKGKPPETKLVITFLHCPFYDRILVFSTSTSIEQEMLAQEIRQLALAADSSSYILYMVNNLLVLQDTKKNQPHQNSLLLVVPIDRKEKGT